MTKLAAISASLVDVRNIAAHKCVRLEIHVPAWKQAGMVLEAFGWPTAVDPVPVAIARLSVPERTQERPKERRSWDELSLVEQAGIRCNERDFWTFMDANDSNDAAESVRAHCGIGSRKELSINNEAARKWRLLDNQYQAWLPGHQAGAAND